MTKDIEDIRLVGAITVFVPVAGTMALIRIVAGLEAAMAYGLVFQLAILSVILAYVAHE